MRGERVMDAGDGRFLQMKHTRLLRLRVPDRDTHIAPASVIPIR